MIRFSPPQFSFSAGEITPLAHARSDWQTYAMGLEKCRGWVPLLQGSVTRAPGSLFRGNTDGNDAARLIGYRVEKDDSLVLEFTPLKMRVWRYGSLVQAGGGGDYELVTPYDAAALTRLHWTQSRDAVYLTDGELPMQKLTRTANNDWTLAEAEAEEGPFGKINKDKTFTLQASAATGTITLTASADLFTNDHIGSRFYMEPVTNENTRQWAANSAFADGDLVLYEKRLYQLTAGTNSGLTPPTHTEGFVKNAINGKYEFLAFPFGIVRITAVTNATTATAEVELRLQPGCVDDATHAWAESAWSNVKGYPRAVLNADRRLVTANTADVPNRLFFTEFDSFEKYTPGTEPDSAFIYDIDENQSTNAVQWLARGSEGIYIGCLGEVFLAFSVNRGEAIGQLNVDFELLATDGAKESAPAIVDGRPIYIARGGKRVQELAYSVQDEGVRPIDLTEPAEHLGKEGFEAVVSQPLPHNLLFFRMATGGLAVLLRNREQRVLGWGIFGVAGGVVEDFCVTPSETGDEDVVTMVVRRTLDGQEVRCIEELAPIYGGLSGSEPLGNAEHFYCASTFDAPGGQSTFDVSHLEGETVSIWTDAGSFTDRVVPAGGQVDLGQNVTRAHIGLQEAESLVRTLPAIGRARDGSVIGRGVRSKSHGIRVHRTAKIESRTVARDYAVDERVSQWKPTVLRNQNLTGDEANSGVLRLDQPSDQALEVVHEFRASGGAPATLQLISPMVEAEVG